MVSNTLVFFDILVNFEDMHTGYLLCNCLCLVWVVAVACLQHHSLAAMGRDGDLVTLHS